MAPFESPNSIVRGFKDRAEALAVQGKCLETFPIMSLTGL
jgi:hypothetical protein